MKKTNLLALLLCLLAAVGGSLAGPFWLVSRAGAIAGRAKALRRARAEQQRQERRAQGWDFWTIEIENLASELKEEKAKLRQQSDELDQRAARIEAEKGELEKMRDEIAQMRSDMDQRVIAIQADEAKNLRSLAQTYSTMTPQAAVTIMKQMDDATAVKILYLMKPDVVGPIFEAMASGAGSDPSLAQRAAELSDRLRLMKSSPSPGGVTSN